MATLVLSAAGTAIGSSMGGSFLGMSMATLGRAAGAVAGRALDRKLLGDGTEPVVHGKLDRIRLTGTGEAKDIPKLYGRMRLGGHVIWASHFTEHQKANTASGSGKGGALSPQVPTAHAMSYSVSIALALCEGEISRVARVWAEGEEISLSQLNMTVYSGSQTQLPDPVMEALEGQGNVPAYRGTAYVVLEDLDLGPFGNRLPQFSFEVVRAAQPRQRLEAQDLPQLVQAVGLMPEVGEYGLASQPVFLARDGEADVAANISASSSVPDMIHAMNDMRDELPHARFVSIPVPWFGNDLRCGDCAIKPKVEQKTHDGERMPWAVSGLTRSTADRLPKENGKPIYRGTPADDAVIEAIAHMRSLGLKTLLHPMLLLDQLESDALPDPASPGSVQPSKPWRGAITLSRAPGLAGSPETSSLAADEITRFFGTAKASDFVIEDDEIRFTGAEQEWSYSRFILHYAALAAKSGGVDAFLLGSELTALLKCRDGAGQFVGVMQMQRLAREARVLLGPNTKLSYGAYWEEYAGFSIQGAQTARYFHLDALWADENIDFIGVNAAIPLADWRSEEGHLDEETALNIHNLHYLRSQVATGEGYDWHYHSPEAYAAQIRTPIEDREHGEPWVWRPKDFVNWWRHAHHERIDGQRSNEPTAWRPQSKPFWFTQIACAAIDRGANAPDAGFSSASPMAIPPHSNGARDDLIQRQYIRAIHQHWLKPSNNPISVVYDAPMVNMQAAFVAGWDVRPFPVFPNALPDAHDHSRYATGHWITGRCSGRSLANVVDEICAASGLEAYDTTGLFGFVHGYLLENASNARSALQPLMLRYGFDAVERGGVLHFVMRSGARFHNVSSDWLVSDAELKAGVEHMRASSSETAERVQLSYIEADGNFEIGSEMAVLPGAQGQSFSPIQLPVVMTRREAIQTVERWLSETRLARDKITIALPHSKSAIGAGDVICLEADDNGRSRQYRIDRVEIGEARILHGVRTQKTLYHPNPVKEQQPVLRPARAASPISALFLDLPLINGDERPHSPHIAMYAKYWPGQAAVYQGHDEAGFALNTLIQAPAHIGTTLNALGSGRAGLRDLAAPLEVELRSGTLASVTETQFLSGANLIAIGDGSPDHWELLQCRNAELIGPKRYRLSHRLRALHGTEAQARDGWPAGSMIVLMNGLTQQIAIAPNQRGIGQDFRYGPANRPYDDLTYRNAHLAFSGHGLRPYAPVHLKAKRNEDGSAQFFWTRQTRIDGAGWDAPEVPLGEEQERYILRLSEGGELLVEQITQAPHWHCSADLLPQLSVAQPITLEVAQVSASYGIGSWARLALTL